MPASLLTFSQPPLRSADLVAGGSSKSSSRGVVYGMLYINVLIPLSVFNLKNKQLIIMPLGFDFLPLLRETFVFELLVSECGVFIDIF